MIRFSQLLVAAGCLLTASCSQAPQATTQPPPARAEDRPNVIFILADDLGYGDLSCYGQTHFETPNIDRLAAAGMRFTQHYAGNTVCAPSRSALMTGQHTGHTAIRGNKEIKPEGQHPMPDSTFTVAEMMRAQGYTTGVFGKWGLGFPGSEGDPNKQGFDRFVGYNCQRLAHNYYPRSLWDNEEKVVFEDNAGFDKGTYAPDYIHTQTLEFLDKHAAAPFFLFVASPVPHAELIAPDSIMDKFRGKYLPEKVYEGYDKGENYRQGPYESQAESHAAFAAMVYLLDKQVGEILDKLEALGIADQTLVLFSSDNGPHQEGGADPDYFDSNGPLRGYKRDLYEGGIRVPLIARWPGKIPAGTTANHISAFWDLLPTLADITGAEAPDNLDGISFLPTLLRKGQQRAHPYLYWEFHERGGRIAFRQGKWKAIKYDYLKAPEAPFQLYDLDRDPGETQNIAADHPELLTEFEALFKNARTESDVFAFGSQAYSGK